MKTNLHLHNLRRICVFVRQFKSGLGAKLMMDLLTQGPPKVAVYGPGQTDVLAVTGMIAPYYKVVEVKFHYLSS